MNVVQKLIRKIDLFFSKNELDTIIDLENQLIDVKMELDETINNYELKVAKLLNMIEEQKITIDKLNISTEEALEHMLNNNRSHKSSALKTWNNVRINNYCIKKNSKTPLITGDTFDRIADKSLRYVIKHIDYVSDDEQYGKAERWAYADETLTSKKGDCEDGAIVLYNIMVKSGIPLYRIRLNAGDVKGGGHAYVTYYSDKNGWVILDWCYWANESVNLNKRWSDSKKYFEVWFSWNEEFVWENIKDDGVL